MKWLGAILGIALILGAIFAAHSGIRAMRAPEEDILYFPPTHARAKTHRPARKTENPSQSSFRKKASEIFDDLPRRDSNKQGGLLSAAPGLAAVSSSLSADNSLIPDGLDFYRECIASEDILLAVRAVCLKNYRFWNPRSPAAAQNSDEISFPEQIKKLADRLSAIR